MNRMNCRQRGTRSRRLDRFLVLPTRSVSLCFHFRSIAMLTWVVYDISLNKTRRKIAKRCLDFGLYRVQKSIFLGDIESNRVEEIILASVELMNIETDSIYVFPMCQADFDKVRIMGQGFDRKMVADEILTKVI